MKPNTVAAMMSSSQLALSVEYGAPLLGMELPRDVAADVQASATIEPGQRFGISRGLGVVPVRGLLTPNAYMLERWMGWTTYYGLAETMQELADNEAVSAIVLEIDSPGGMVMGIEAAVNAIAAAAAEKPVHALVHPLAASAAYWLASQATDISLTPGSQVGSIGVMAQTWAPATPDRSGDMNYIVTSSHARAKRPDPATEEGQAELRRRLDQTESIFHAAVAQGRGIAPDDLTAQLSVTDDVRDGGAVFAGDDARTRGLVDALETRAAFYDRVGAQYAPRPRSASRAFRAQAAAAMARALI
ncbi:S49 family peptidase [Pontibaca salina]|uniref:S49 family peptidase n=1 Tax=Pontibaca salina TaxID=2795731 RepID=A0A934LZ63_9RHOB|nr:S49 family peptidase [Pontibaca salina]MBI6628333.1 S49 family peptidase [Pontibaca salina]